ncbi:MAG: alpha-mannosidase [Promethearchaeota archaeon]
MKNQTRILKKSRKEIKERWLRPDREISLKRKLRLWKNTCPELEDLIIHQVGESHIDCAWMWRYEQTRKKAQVTFKKAILHAKMFPETYCFALSEPLLLDWIKQDDPKLFKQIQETVKAGNIELVGGSYVEPDCMMPSGESFVRQRLYGMRFFRDNFNILPKVEWFLDSFGYNRGLPQILTKSGAKYFWTTKITWNLQTTFPFVNFWWQGPDGSKILTGHFNMGDGAIGSWKKFGIGHRLLLDNGQKSWNYKDNYDDLINHVGEEFCPHVGYFFGLGDGGHGPTHKEVAIANELSKSPMFKWSRVENFFEELNKYSERFPIWDDELYLENHRGCFSNHSDVKRNNRKFENVLISLEILAVLTSLITPNFSYPSEQFEVLWKITLKNQFHDVIPGSSIPEVYDDCWDDWKLQDSSISNMIKAIGSNFSSQNNERKSQSGREFFLFNSLPWERTSRLFIPATDVDLSTSEEIGWKPNPAKLLSLNSENLEFYCQPVSKENESWKDSKPAGWWTIITLKPLSITPVKLVMIDEITIQSENKALQNIISNGITHLELSQTTGAFVDLRTENLNKGSSLLKGTSSNLTNGFLDDDKSFPAWNLTPEYWNFPLDLPNDKGVKIEVVDNGPIFASLQINRLLGKDIVIQKITLFKALPEIYLEYITDWSQPNTMLKILYSTTTNSEIATTDGAYAIVNFKTNPETPCDKARYEKICHKFVDLSSPDKKWGIALINEGKYAFDVNGGDIQLTLLRSPRYPPPSPEAWVNLERDLNKDLYNHEPPEFSEIGPFRCNYVLYPHSGSTLSNPDGTVNPKVRRKAEEFNNPIIIIPLNGNTEVENRSLLNGEPLLEISPSNIALGALKYEEWKKDNSIIVRFFEDCGLSVSAEVNFHPKIAKMIIKIEETDLLERTLNQDTIWNKKEGKLSFKIDKFEIRSFKLIFK